MLFDILIVAVVATAIAFGWMARADKAKRDIDRAYAKGYADALRVIERKLEERL